MSGKLGNESRSHQAQARLPTDDKNPTGNEIQSWWTIQRETEGEGDVAEVEVFGGE